MSKNKSFTKISKPKEKKETKEVQIPLNISNFIKTTCEVYVEYLSKYFNVKKGLKVNVKQYEEDDPLGHYLSATNTIEFFLRDKDLAQAEKSINEFIKTKDPNRTAMGLSKDAKFWGLYFTEGDATLFHEMEHYRRTTEHSGKGAHESLKEDLFGDTAIRSFAESHLVIRSRFIAEGFWEVVHTKVKSNK